MRILTMPTHTPLPTLIHAQPLEQFLAGARNMDEHFATAPARENIPLLMGLLGLWNSSFLGHECRAILPYAQALLRFPAHVQQVGEGTDDGVVGGPREGEEGNARWGSKLERTGKIEEGHRLQ